MQTINYKLPAVTQQPNARFVSVAKLTADVSQLPMDKKFEIILRNYADSKTDKQRRLNWTWNNQIAKSGVGNTDDANKVHLNAKWQFARPLLLAGEDDYSLWIQDLTKMLEVQHPNDNQRLKNLFVHGVHTEQMLPEMVATFLTNLQNYWTNKGVPLVDPDLKEHLDRVA